MDVLKCHCKKTGQDFLLELEKIGGKYCVNNMTHLSKEQGKSIATTVDQTVFYSAKNLLSCRGCQGRLIGGCDCAKKYFSCKAGVYNFGCIYCKDIVIDRDISSYSEKEIIVGQNQKIDLKRFYKNRPMKNIHIAGGWDPARFGSERIDVDFSVIMFHANGGIETVYYGNKIDRSCSVLHRGDNLTGEAGYVSGLYNDDEIIDIDTQKLPSSVQMLYFVINVYSKQSFNSIRNTYVRIYDDSRDLLKYNVEQTPILSNALVVASLKREAGSFVFNSIGKYTNGSLDKLEDICKDMYRRE